jgi:hypothetical protein
MIIGDIVDTFDVIGWLILIGLAIIALCGIYWVGAIENLD